MFQGLYLHDIKFAPALSRGSFWRLPTSGSSSRKGMTVSKGQRCESGKRRECPPIAHRGHPDQKSGQACLPKSGSIKEQAVASVSPRARGAALPAAAFFGLQHMGSYIPARPAPWKARLREPAMADDWVNRSNLSAQDWISVWQYQSSTILPPENLWKTTVWLVGFPST